MSVLDVVIKEEYDRINRVIKSIESELSELPKGYISEKKINGNAYYYLQNREKKKIKSKYIKRDNVEAYKLLIAHRKELEQELKDMKSERRKLERILKYEG